MVLPLFLKTYYSGVCYGFSCPKKSENLTYLKLIAVLEQGITWIMTKSQGLPI